MVITRQIYRKYIAVCQKICKSSSKNIKKCNKACIGYAKNYLNDKQQEWLLAQKVQKTLQMDRLYRKENFMTLARRQLQDDAKIDVH